MAVNQRHPGSYKGPCGRGIFALVDWSTPLKRPGHLQQTKTETTSWKAGQKLMMKYKYEGNVSSPLGKELTVNRKDPVVFVSRHDQHWIKVRTEENGEEGYVPDTYVMVNPDSVTSLPWLGGQQEKAAEQQSVEFKPYKSAYSPKETETSVQQDQSQYYCWVCDKQLNGPIPYNVHLNSKAHKEEKEVQAYNASNE